MHNKGWFAIPGIQAGDRTIDQQITGLDSLLADVRDRTVLDLGCAEGMVARVLLDAGAKDITGIDSNASFVDCATRVIGARDDCRFLVGDLNKAPGRFGFAGRMFDIVLMLSILHKLRDPLRSVREWAGVAGDVLVIRLPGSMPGVVVRKYGDRRPLDVLGCLASMSPPFVLEGVKKGYQNEWVGYFRLARNGR